MTKLLSILRILLFMVLAVWLVGMYKGIFPYPTRENLMSPAPLTALALVIVLALVLMVTRLIALARMNNITTFLTSLLRFLLFVLISATIAYSLAVASEYLDPPMWSQLENPLLASALLMIAACFAIIICLRYSSTHYSAFKVHRTLLEIEMNLTEMFARLKPKGVDKRRDRMVDIMKEAELCKHNPTASFVAVSNMDRGASQKTARSIIDSDRADLAGFRTRRRHARINAFAYEAVLTGQFKTARSHILEKHLEAISKGQERPVILNGLRRLLKLPKSMTEAQIHEELEKDSPLGVFPASVHMAIKFWRHPHNLIFRNDEIEAKGKEALRAMRLF